LSAGLPVDVIAMLGGLPFCARSFDDAKEGSSTAAAGGEQQIATDKDAVRLRKEEVTVWMNATSILSLRSSILE
uniref:Kinesin motor domain-containing protein n=1 Tax=Anisakis simplex TaxID=6269 RepID=A0A0M3JEK0_ANISI